MRVRMLMEINIRITFINLGVTRSSGMNRVIYHGHPGVQPPIMIEDLHGIPPG